MARALKTNKQSPPQTRVQEEPHCFYNWELNSVDASASSKQSSRSIATCRLKAHDIVAGFKTDSIQAPYMVAHRMRTSEALQSPLLQRELLTFDNASGCLKNFELAHTTKARRKAATKVRQKAATKAQRKAKRTTKGTDQSTTEGSKARPKAARAR